MSEPERQTHEPWRSFELSRAAALDPAAVLAGLGTTPDGLSESEAARRLREGGPNAVRSHGARPLAVLVRQLRNPLLPILVVATLVSFGVGERVNAGIILTIVVMSVGLGFVNEYRSERAVEALHSSIRHLATTTRAGSARSIDVTELVPGDVVDLKVGDVVPADVRLLSANRLECDEGVLTGESFPAVKAADAVPDRGASALELPSCAFMGTVVRAGTARAVVVCIGPRTTFGRIALRLGERPAETAFQVGLRDFSKLLVRVTLSLCVAIFAINAALGRPLLDSALFALAIAVGLTPELLPAIVTISLSTGARRLAKRSVVVKRLVSIEDLGNIEVLFTDKTGTLTEGAIAFSHAVDPNGAESPEVLRLGLACTEAVVQGGRVAGGNPLDEALWEAALAAPQSAATGAAILAKLPFDYERRLMSVVADDGAGRRTLITKGAPEAVLERSPAVTDEARRVLDAEFDAGARVVAVATRAWDGGSTIGPEDERDLTLAGFLSFRDPPKPDVAESLAKLGALGIDVRIVTGDNARVARKVCADIGLPAGDALTGTEIEALSDEELRARMASVKIFARVSPEQKSRIIRAARAGGADVAFLGDGVNDAVALHDADVGVSVESAADVAKDAADVVLLEKDLGVLAEGVVEGRRIFSNTIKYVLMGTSSNFGNMFSAAGASLFLKFLPMLPSQILLNNLMYDSSQTAIPTDHVDPEMLERPARWDTGFIRRFMAFFGPISSLYDFLTFAVMLKVFHTGETLFHTGWFVESLATQTLVVFVIRTRRVPFLRSRPSLPLLAAVGGCAAAGAVLPFVPPIARLMGFVPLPVSFLLILVLMVVTYLALAEAGKALFYRQRKAGPPLASRKPPHHRRVERLATRWSALRLEPPPPRAGASR